MKHRNARLLRKILESDGDYIWIDCPSRGLRKFLKSQIRYNQMERYFYIERSQWLGPEHIVTNAIFNSELEALVYKIQKCDADLLIEIRRKQAYKARLRERIIEIKKKEAMNAELSRLGDDGRHAQESIHD